MNVLNFRGGPSVRAVASTKAGKNLAGEISKAHDAMRHIYALAVGHGETHASLGEKVRALGKLRASVLRAAAEKFGVVPGKSKGTTLAAVAEKVSRPTSSANVSKRGELPPISETNRVEDIRANARRAKPVV